MTQRDIRPTSTINKVNDHKTLCPSFSLLPSWPVRRSFRLRADMTVILPSPGYLQSNSVSRLSRRCNLLLERWHPQASDNDTISQEHWPCHLYRVSTGITIFLLEDPDSTCVSSGTSEPSCLLTVQYDVFDRSMLSFFLSFFLFRFLPNITLPSHTFIILNSFHTSQAPESSFSHTTLFTDATLHNRIHRKHGKL